MNPNLALLNAMPEPLAEATLLACCGSHIWARRMADERPFQSLDHVFGAADRIWQDLAPEDWLQAFRAHPRIGEKKAEAQTGAAAQVWSEKEQAGAHSASAETLAALAEANAAYDARFGHIFIVCATGKSAEEMLAICRARLQNDPDRELHVAAAEQARITRLRLEKLLAAG